MMSSRELLDCILTELQQVDETPADIEPVGEFPPSYESFLAMLVEAVRAQVPGDNDAEALEQAIAWLNRRKHGFELAFLEFLEGNSLVRADIVNSILHAAGQQRMDRHRACVLARYVDVLGWEQRLKLVRECKVHFDLPDELRDRPDWCLAGQVGELILVCAESFDPIQMAKR
ncbi:hypothetical protein H5P28_00665 [Ruficoccus amylovorans]|uniref:Uncharacterized protein n=1 Tax=Ruficoccus amylovorans TaxID=1804625 RepID=A0A842H8P9_9BACT|nr:hypothetical protein [Ruficoccus amylovorans]MBC2592762.1 hypothetical protein [Ruficoccus amylovorans]